MAVIYMTEVSSKLEEKKTVSYFQHNAMCITENHIPVILCERSTVNLQWLTMEEMEEVWEMGAKGRKKEKVRDFNLVVQWLRICLPMQVT